MGTDPVLLEMDAGVTTITLNRPENRNSMTPDVLARFGEHWLAAAALARWRDRLGHTWLTTVLDLATTARESGSAIWSGRAPLSGRELRSLFGLEEGPRLGRLLDALRRAWIDGDVGTPEEAKRWVAEWLRREEARGIPD